MAFHPEPADSASASHSSVPESMIGDARRYASFFRKQAVKAEEWKRTSAALVVLLLIALVSLLLWLKSDWPVWLYITLLFGIVVWGFYRLRAALQAMFESAKHLEGFADAVADQTSRADLVAKIYKRVTDEDNSNVPEALMSLTQSGTGASVETVAKSALVEPLTELTFAAFLRVTLVLAGLFGTVLFFALELDGAGILSGDLGELLPGLRGALASTLTGILGSLTIGLVASAIDRRLEEIVWQTEAFLSSHLLPILTRRRDRAEVRTEADLWEELRAEVAELSDSIAKSASTLSDDAHAHTRTLAALGDQLSELPQIVVPQELAGLHESVASFARSAEIIERTLPPLVEAVGTLGVYAPAKILQTVEAHGQTLDAVSGRVDQAVGEIRSVSGEVRSAAAHVDTAAGALEEVTGGLDASVGRVEASGAEMRSGVRSVSESNERSRSALSQLQEQIRPLAERVRVMENRLGGIESVAELGAKAETAPLARLLFAPLWSSWRKS